MKLQAFEHEGAAGVHHRFHRLAHRVVEAEEGPETGAGANDQCPIAELDRPTDERPVAADFNGVAACRFGHRVRQ